MIRISGFSVFILTWLFFWGAVCIVATAAFGYDPINNGGPGSSVGSGTRLISSPTVDNKPSPPKPTHRGSGRIDDKPEIKQQ